MHFYGEYGLGFYFFGDSKFEIVLSEEVFLVCFQFYFMLWISTSLVQPYFLVANK